MEQTKQLLRSLLVPLESGQVLLPSATVTEVLPLATVQEIEAPGWVMGLIPWHGGRIPLLSLETLFEGVAPEHGSRTRMAVLNAVGDQDAPTHYAVLARAVPRLVTLEPHMIEPEELSMLPDGVLSKAKLAGQPVYIPDMDWIEACLAELSLQAAA